jgi:predicted nucleic acid-binding protein
MASTEPFLDTNVLVYLLNSGTDKADRSDALVKAGAVISVQVLNEFTRVGLRKFSMSFAQVRSVLQGARMTCRVVPLTVEVHEQALRIAERYQLHIFDANIVAAALLAGCPTLYSEDMHDGLVIDGLTIRNPYRSAGPT